MARDAVRRTIVPTEPLLNDDVPVRAIHSVAKNLVGHFAEGLDRDFVDGLIVDLEVPQQLLEAEPLDGEQEWVAIAFRSDEQELWSFVDVVGVLLGLLVMCNDVPIEVVG